MHKLFARKELCLVGTEDVARDLDAVSDAKPCLATALPLLAEAFNAEKAIAYSLTSSGDALRVETMHGYGIPDIRQLHREFNAYLQSAGRYDWAGCNAIRPGTHQCNVAMDTGD